MLLRQVQAGPLQGHRLRALRRRGDALQGAPRAHGPRRPGLAGLPHLVLQGRAEPDRLPDRHGSERAGEGPLLRRVDDHLGRRRGPRQGHRQTRERSQKSHRLLRVRTAEAHPGAERVAGAARQVPGGGRADQVRRRGPHLGRLAEADRGAAAQAEGRRAGENDQRTAQDLRRGDLRHRGLHRRGDRADAGGLEDLHRDEAEGRRQRRDRLPRAQGPLRLAVRLGRVLPRRHGRRSGARPARTGRPRGRLRGTGADHQQLQRPETGPRREAAESRLRLPQLRQPAGLDDPRRRAGDPAGAAPDGAARRRPLRDLGPQRPLPPRDQPQQPAEKAARPRRARDHRQQREADAAGGGRRAVRQRPPRAPGHGPRQPSR